MKFLKIVGWIKRWVDRLRKNVVLCKAFGYARYSKGMEKIVGFGYEKQFIFTFTRVEKFSNSLRDESDEPRDIFKDKYMRWFLRHSIKRDGCAAFNQ